MGRTYAQQCYREIYACLFWGSYICIENIVLLFLFVYLEERLMEFAGVVVLVVEFEPSHSPEFLLKIIVGKR